eukprot:7161713-Prymnesium_polylepis.1
MIDEYIKEGKVRALARAHSLASRARRHRQKVSMMYATPLGPARPATRAAAYERLRPPPAADRAGRGDHQAAPPGDREGGCGDGQEALSRRRLPA